MADIVFLLLVFFILTYKVEVDRTKMDLPDTWIRSKVPEKAAVISIAPPDDITAPLTVRVSTGEEMSLPVSTTEEVVTFASTEVARDPNKEFIIKADEQVPYEHVDAVRGRP
jgi:biopolymer transport protein ExbD